MDMSHIKSSKSPIKQYKNILYRPRSTELVTSIYDDNELNTNLYLDQNTSIDPLQFKEKTSVFKYTKPKMKDSAVQYEAFNTPKSSSNQTESNIKITPNKNE